MIGLDRNFAEAYFHLGWCKGMTGCLDEAISLQGRGLRLSPRDPLIAIWHWDMGVVHLLQSRIDEAIIWFQRARGENPNHAFIHGWLASAYSLDGQMQRASAELGEAQRLGERYLSIARLKASQTWLESPSIHAKVEETFFAGLRRAGMPED